VVVLEVVVEVLVLLGILHLLHLLKEMPEVMLQQQVRIQQEAVAVQMR
jgi:hypothetical protein